MQYSTKVDKTEENLTEVVRLVSKIEEDRVFAAIISKRLSPHYRALAWQGGYAAFSVSQSVVDKVVDYVSNQKEYHKKMSFEEYEEWLREMGMDPEKDLFFKD